MKMPKVSKCSVTDCAYNWNMDCRTPAITVGGNSEHPRCDTYVRAPEKAGSEESHAGVGACKVAGCRHNRDLECHAGKIEVGFSGAEVDCMTFEER